MRTIVFAIAISAWLAPAGAAEPSGGTQWYVLPVVFWTPETRLGFGALGGIELHAAPGARPSYVQASAVYTLESQSSVDLILQLYPSERMVVDGMIRFADFPESFWGIGPRTRPQDEVRYASRVAEVTLAPERYVVPARLRVGPRVHFRRESVGALGAAGPISDGSAPGAEGFTTIGVGATATWDTRDSPFWPTRGTFAQGWYLVHPGALVNGPDFGRGAADLRRFFPLWRGHVLGLRANVEAAHGAVPFTLYPRLGGADTLRGYYRGRWRDRVSWASQSEYRFPIGGRLGAVVFAGAGGVAPSVDEVVRQPVRFAAGAGLRYRLTSAGVNVRADLAVGAEGPAFYLLTLEAF